ncbi:MAG: hypothetical protein H0W50_00755 [Parachlamydiaceae bacterium]|nr:hypothetical protein [Parachlamydiaceae bacterium]
MNFNEIKENSEIDVRQQFEPKWLSQSTFEAETSTSEKISRVVNMIIFTASLYSLYGYMTGGTGLLAYASYLSLGFAARKITSIAIGYMVYPAAFKSLPFLKANVVTRGKTEIQTLIGQDFIIRSISIHKSGSCYDGVLITHRDTILNGKWIINALGNDSVMEYRIIQIAKRNFAFMSNTLLINGPGVCKSGGWPTRYQMGAGFEAGIKFLEQQVKATHIIMYGLSLGGGMMGEAILNHDFSKGMKDNIRYLSITDRSFSRLSTIADATKGKIVKSIFYITGTELDGVGAAQKLSHLGIQQIIIQHISNDATGDDGVISDSISLAYELHKNASFENKIFLESECINHGLPLPKDIDDNLKILIKEFFES